MLHNTANQITNFLLVLCVHPVCVLACATPMHTLYIYHPMCACACTSPTYALPVYDWLRLPITANQITSFFSGCACTPRCALLVYDWVRLPITANQISSFCLVVVYTPPDVLC